MIVTLDTIYKSQGMFVPAWGPGGGLFAVELTSRFTGLEAPVRMPTELLLPQLNPGQRLALFQEQLALLEQMSAFFSHHQIITWLNINGDIAMQILQQKALLQRIKRLEFIYLAIDENYPGINYGQHQAGLAKLARTFPLILSNAGGGLATTRAITDNLFRYLILDKTFVRRMLEGPAFEPFIDAIARQFSSFCRGIILDGIDNVESRNRVPARGVAALRGNYWPPLSPDALISLVNEFE